MPLYISLLITGRKAPMLVDNRHIMLYMDYFAKIVKFDVISKFIIVILPGV